LDALFGTYLGAETATVTIVVRHDQAVSFELSGLEIAYIHALTAVITFRLARVFDKLSSVALFRRVEEVGAAIIATEANPFCACLGLVAERTRDQVLFTGLAQYPIRLFKRGFSLVATASGKVRGKNEADVVA